MTCRFKGDEEGFLAPGHQLQEQQRQHCHLLPWNKIINNNPALPYPVSDIKQQATRTDKKNSGPKLCRQHSYSFSIVRGESTSAAPGTKTFNSTAGFRSSGSNDGSSKQQATIYQLLRHIHEIGPLKWLATRLSIVMIARQSRYLRSDEQNTHGKSNYPQQQQQQIFWA